MLVVAFRTHVWDEHVDYLARRIYASAAGCEFVILADETLQTFDTTPFLKIAHTVDFSEFGLPLYPTNRSMWYNADYPLYRLRKERPDATHYAMIEYDVCATVDLFKLSKHVEEAEIDLVATHLEDASKANFPWHSGLVDKFNVPLKALIPFMVISGRAIDHMYGKRRAIVEHKYPEQESDWPFCEGFIPSASAEIENFKYLDYKTLYGCPYFWVEEPIHIADKRCNEPNRINHPVMGGARFIRAHFEGQKIHKLFENPEKSLYNLSFYHPNEYVSYLFEQIKLFNSDDLKSEFIKLSGFWGWDGNPSYQ